MDTPSKQKRIEGRTPKHVRQYLEDNFATMTDDEIALKVNRRPEWVRAKRAEWIANNNTGIEKSSSLLLQLRSRHFYPQVKNILLEPELDFFEKEWLVLINQFSNHEIIPTDELQIKDLIITGIFIDRQNVRRKNILEELNRLQLILTKEQDKDDSIRDDALISLTKQTIISLHASFESIGKQTAVLEEQKERLLKSLKATREARLKQVQERSKNFFGLVEYLDQMENRRREERMAGLMKISVDRETARLSELHEYEDGTVDRPLLSADILEQYEKEDK